MTRAIFILVLMVATSAYVQGQSPDRKRPRLQQELMQLLAAEYEAEDKKDFAALDRLLGDDFIFTPPNGTVSDKKKFIDSVRKNDEEPATDQKLSYDEIRTYDYGKTAVVSFLLLVKSRDKDGKDQTSRYRNTVVWVYQQKHWRLAAIHVNRVRP